MPHHKERLRGHEALGLGEDVFQQYQAVMENHDPNVTYCCVPTGCHMPDDTLPVDDLSDTLRVICNNENCQEGRFMHKLCFEQWEESVLTYLRSTGRARSWSEKQRLQNLWTKKGYDLAYKACGCKCNKGHLRKDLDWIPPPKPVEKGNEEKKKRNKKKKNDKPSLTLNGNKTVAGVNGVVSAPTNGSGLPMMRLRSSSMSSNGSGSGGSPPSSASAEYPMSPTHVSTVAASMVAFAVNNSNNNNAIVNAANNTTTTNNNNNNNNNMNVNVTANKLRHFFSDRRERHGSGSIFSRRQDYSSFNTLPRHKINSYHIKMEDEGSHGNDDTRCFLLSTLSTNKANRIPCILCHNNMIVFDRYPLIDGTFFMSPRQHSKGCVPVKMDGRVQYLNAVCMACLEGWNTALRCRYCQSRWTGSELILGSMYSYDIFAATPCCPERLRCNHCHKMVMPPENRLQYFSDYSHSVACPNCRLIDFHFVKSLSTYNRRERGE